MNEARYREAEKRLWDSLGSIPTERRLQLGRIGARVRVQELGEGPTVLLLHGGSICGSSWAPLAVRLAGFRCVLLDRPGCGLSEPLAVGLRDTERLGEFADVLVADVLDALDVDRAHVLATSFGGYMALRSAAAHPDRIDRLLLFGFPVGAPISKTPVVMRIGSVPWMNRIALSVPPSQRMVRSILNGIGLREALRSGRVTQPMLDWFLSMLRDTDTMRNETSSLPRILTFWRGMNDDVLLPPALLRRVTAPTYFLWGDADPFGGAQTARAFVVDLPDAELELMPGAGHAVWMDDAGHAAAVTQRFLSA